MSNLKENSIAVAAFLQNKLLCVFLIEGTVTITHLYS